MLRADLELTRHDQNDRVVVRDPINGRVYAFSEPAFTFLERWNPELDLEQNIAASLGHEASPELLNGARHLIKQVDCAGLLSTNAEGHAAVAKRRPLNPFFITLPLFNPQWLLVRLRPVTWRLFSHIGLVAWTLVIFATIGMLVTYSGPYTASSVLFRHSRLWGLAYLLLFLATVVHEFGHACACDRFGIKVRRIGLLIYLINPCAYADISEAWLLPNIKQRIVVSLAGVYIEGYLWATACWMWLISKAGSTLRGLLFILTVTLGLRILVNLIPFLRLDGYWVLVDVLGIPNLRSKAFGYLLSFLPIVGRYWRPVRRPSLRQAMILTSYGMLSTGFAAFSVSTAIRKIHAWLLHVSPATGDLCFWLLLAVITGFSVYYLYNRPRARLNR
jgi:hypothetical protein